MPAPTVEVLGPLPVTMPAHVGWGNGATTGTVNIQTTAATMLVVCTITDQPPGPPTRGITSITSAGLVFTRYVQQLATGADPTLWQEIWTAPVSGPISSQSLSITIANGADSATAIIFGLIGGTALDADPSLPAETTYTLTNPLDVTFNTSNANDLIIYLGGHSFTTDFGPPSGFTTVLHSNDADGARQVGQEIAAYAPGTILTGSSVTSPITGGLISLMTVFAVNDGSTTVPNVVGDDDTTARAAIIAAGLIVGSVTSIAGGTPGVVQSQSPVGGTAVAGGSAVNLVEYEGNVVPNVVNTSLTVVAPGILAASGFTVGLVTYEASGIIITGNVIRQTPAAGSFAAAGSGVNLVVSTGLPSLRVPDLFGLSQTDAINTLLALGLVVGAIGSAPSQFVPPNTVQTQNPSAGTPVGPGTIVSFVLSTGIPAIGTLFDFEATVISQYANSPTILQLVNNLNLYIDQSANFANFFNFVWNVDTAVGFGLDIWGKIVGVSRLLQIPNTTDYVGFDNGTRSPPDWQSMGSDQPPGPPVGGAMYTGFNATSTYILGDDAYRQLILAKAFANICTTTAPAINTILQNLYGPGTAWVLNTGPMAISYNLSFKPSAIQLAILEQSGVIPTPPGVSVTIVVPP
jgi:beta-lactam-binding protein with PASTA domain